MQASRLAACRQPQYCIHSLWPYDSTQFPHYLTTAHSSLTTSQYTLEIINGQIYQAVYIFCLIYPCFFSTKSRNRSTTLLSYGCNDAVRFQVSYFGRATSTCHQTSPYLSICHKACKKIEDLWMEVNNIWYWVVLLNYFDIRHFQTLVKSDKDSGQLIGTPACLPASRKQMLIGAYLQNRTKTYIKWTL
jgi:hypothetical protein